jgi:Flp pilus assembly protein TadD
VSRPLISAYTANFFLASLALGILTILAVMSDHQLQFWRNSIALFGHTVDVSPNNASAESSLGISYEHARDTNRAIVCFRTAKMIEPGDFQNRRDLAGMLGKQGYLSAAEQEYRELLVDDPADARNHLGLANTLAGEGAEVESVTELNETLRLDPDCIDALNNLAWILATSPQAEVRDGARAMALAEHACELTHFEQTIYIGTLAAAYAQAGQFDDAAATAQRACALAEKNGETALLQRNRQLLQFYQAHKPARE